MQVWATFDVETQIVNFATNCSGGMVFVPELVVPIGVFLVPHDDSGTRVAATTFDVQYQTIQSALYEKVLSGSTRVTSI